LRLIARFANDLGNNFEVIDVYDKDIKKTLVDKKSSVIKTITDKYPCAIWFERKIKDDFGIRFEGSFDERPLLHHERFPNVHPMRKDFSGEIEFGKFKPYSYEVIEGEGVFEVGVGPIHAGIIEPGHFHFSQEGESILHQEVRHFYKYRAIEKMIEDKDPLEAFEIVEKISGNESIAYQIAFLEALVNLDEDIKKYNAILLELERITHHLTDLGFIPNDAGFGAALAFCSIKAEETRRVLKDLSGHRFGFGSIRGEAKEIDKEYLKNFLDYLKKELTWFEDWIIDIPSLWDRLDKTGILRTKKAIKYGVVGIVARASGLKLDRRDNNFYKKYGFELQREKSGDVAARFKVRLKECFNSIEIIKNMLDFKPKKRNIEINDGEFTSFIESSLGELFIYLKITDGKIDRFFARDPSFINWQALHLMMSGNIIADFPLINKSCDLSYAGSDL